MAELKGKLLAREAERYREEAEAEAHRKEQEHEARLKRHDNHRLSRETVSVGVITELECAREPGTGRVTRYVMLSNRIGEFTAWSDELAHYPQNIHDPINIYLLPDGAVMAPDIREGVPESHETIVRPEHVGTCSGATV